MTNHFKTALNDPKFQEKFKDKPYHMAVLHALAKYREAGNSLHDHPWFFMAKGKKQPQDLQNAA
jgi:hypothetical protein